MKKLLFLLPIVLVCFSCKKGLLDQPPIDRVAEEVVWTDANLVRAYHTELYNAVPHGHQQHMLSKFTDEAINTTPAGQAPNNFARGIWNGDNITGVSGGANGGSIYYWNQGYQYIRKINVFLERMAQNQVSLSDKVKLIAEAKFLRAWVYFNLIERFGGVPIVTKTYKLGETETFTRATFDQCVAFIDKDLTEAIPDLPQKIAADAAGFGRATQDACLALRSRVFLYAASALNNPTNDLAKWQKASDAAAALLTRGYTLYPDYKAAFNRPTGSANNELIFARNFTSAQGHGTPPNNLGRRYNAYGGWWASNGPSQNLVDDYDMATTGLPAITYSGSGATYTRNVNVASGYNPQAPYANRDPRFDATIIHDETVYHGDLHEMWISSDAKTWGFDSYKTSSDNPTSNYVLKKFMPEDGPIAFSVAYTQPWPIFRLAEIYLNYAEAQFELGNEGVARQYINLVRKRPSVNMPDVAATVTGAALRERLYKERRVELAFEGHRFWDVRRWKIAMDVENRPLFGMDIVKDVATGVKTYTPAKKLDRKFEDKMYLIPIETNEVRRNANPGFAQNPGW
jgi:starch-binding outer membrane protein, SusD/RagB family